MSTVQGFGVPLVRKFAHSILLCLELLFRNRLIHCDLKPENVLLKQAGRSGIKVLRSHQLFYTVNTNVNKVSAVIDEMRVHGPRVVNKGGRLSVVNFQQPTEQSCQHL